MDRNYRQLFAENFLALDRIGAGDLFSSLRETYSPMQIIEQFLVPAMEDIGSGWESGTIALSQVYMSGRICEDLVDQHLPPKSPDRKDQPKMAIAVFDDYHEIGKRIVYSYLRASGYELSDYGRVTAKELIDGVRADDIEIMLVSVLMLPSALRLKPVISELAKERPGTRVIVGGAPFRFDGNLWKEIGAFAMGEKSSDVVQIIADIKRRSAK